MRRFIFCWFIFILLGITTACNSTPPAPPKLVSEATIAPGTKGAVIPTLPTATDTLTSTPEPPTDTPTITLTPTVPTSTLTLTASVTKLPTFTRTAPYTPQPIYSPTPTKRPTKTPTPNGPTITPSPQKCSIAWFFNPRPSPCPLNPATTGPAAYQQFEQGVMIWYGPEKVIYAIYQSKGKERWHQYSDEYAAGIPDSDPSLAPPEGKFQPIRGFGLIWRSKAHVKDRLGWAITGETGYTAGFQVDGTGNRYIQVPTGEVYMLKGDYSAWEVYKSGP